MYYVSHQPAAGNLCRLIQAKNRNHPSGLVWGILCLFIALSGQVKAQTAPASITVSGACLDGTYTLAKHADNYEGTGKPSYQGSGTVNIGGTPYNDVPIAIYYETAGPAWVIAFDGQPYLSNPSTGQLPPMSGWVAEDGGVGRCEGSAPITVLGTSGTVSIAPSVVAPVCAGSPVSLTATTTNLTSPVTYSWSSNPAGFSGSGAIFTQNAPSVSSNTNFIVKVTATSGSSSATASVGVTVKPTPGLVAGTPTNPTTCGSSDGSIAFTTTNLPNGTYSLSYTGSGSPKMVTVSNNAFTLTGLPAGAYSNFSLTNNGCVGSVATTVTLSNPTAPVAGLTNNGPITCGNSATLTASGGGTYLFSPGATQVGGSSGNTATVTSAGTYSVIVTGVNGCTASAQTTVTQSDNSPLAFASSPASASTVEVGATVSTSVSVSGSGQPSYQWFKDNVSNPVSSQTSPTLTLANVQLSDAGTYFVVVTGTCNSLTSTGFNLTVNQAGPTPFSITGVTTVSCQTITAGQREVRFTPQYAGTTGQPISFSVVNEMLPTTAPGPYTLRLYTDNPAITLRARQTGTATSASFVYNWLAACNASNPAPGNTAPRVVNTIPAQTVTVGQGFTYIIPSNTFTDDQTPGSLGLSVSGLPAGLQFTTPATISGTPSQTGVSNVTVTATDPGGLMASTQFTITVSPSSTTGPAPFSITRVTTVSCQTISAGERRVSFTPQYAGTTGQPISFSVVNEMLPTTAPGPYTLRLYTDNPVITLKARQTGTAGEATFSYNWLAACNGNNPTARLGAESPNIFQVTVLGNPVVEQTTQVEVRGAAGLPLQLVLTDIQGHTVAEKRIGQAGLVEQVSLPLNHQPAGLLLLRVSTPTRSLVVKVVKQ